MLDLPAALDVSMAFLMKIKRFVKILNWIEIVLLDFFPNNAKNAN